MNKILTLTDGTDIFRVRKENCGCSIFTKTSFAEGNDAMFNILETFSEVGVVAGIDQFENKFPDKKNVIRRDLLRMFEILNSKNILLNMGAMVRKYYNDKKNV